MNEGLNRVMLFGNLGDNPELRYTQGGQPVLHVRMATTESYLDKDKQRKERTDWHNVVIWGKRGEALGKILAKGSSIFVEGSLRTSSYDDKKSGEKRYKTEVVANNVILGGGGKRGERSDENPDAEPPREQRREDPRGGYSRRDDRRGPPRGAPPAQGRGVPPSFDEHY